MHLVRTYVNAGQMDPSKYSDPPPRHRHGDTLGFCLNVLKYEPFVVCKFVAVVVSRNNVHEEYVLGFGVESRDLHLVTGEHPSARTKAPPAKNIYTGHLVFSLHDF